MQIVADLGLLLNANENSVLELLRLRCDLKKHFCKAGEFLWIILQNSNAQYADEDECYHNLPIGEKVCHPFSLVDRLLELQPNMLELNRSIIFKGRSGSGKSKYFNSIVKYIAKHKKFGCNGRNDDISNAFSCVDQILNGFGSAPTELNCCSSRYSKCLSIHVNQSNAYSRVANLELSVYGMEWNRIRGPAVSEMSHNFNIFYALLADLEPEKLSQMLLSKDVSYYKCLGANSTVVNCSVKLQSIISSLDILIGDNQAVSTVDILRTIACIMHIFNVIFRPKYSSFDNSKGDLQLKMPCELVKSKYYHYIEDVLGIGSGNKGHIDILEKLLTTRNVTTDASGRLAVFSIELNVVNAMESAIGFACNLYERLFNWIIKTINSKFKQLSNNIPDLQNKHDNVLHIVDSCGFENLEENYLNQFLTNYSNERVHQFYVSSKFTVRY